MSTTQIRAHLPHLAMLLLAFALLATLAVEPTLPYPPGPSVAGIIVNDSAPSASHNQDVLTLNPQPEPPGKAVAGIIINDGIPTTPPTQDAPSFNPQPDPPGSVNPATAA